MGEGKLGAIIVRRRITYYGHVQGVGFRYTAKRAAESLGLTGWVQNQSDGTVVVEAQGSPSMIEELMKAIYRQPFIEIDWIDNVAIPYVEEKNFVYKFY